MELDQQQRDCLSRDLARLSAYERQSLKRGGGAYGFAIELHGLKKVAGAYMRAAERRQAVIYDLQATNWVDDAFTLDVLMEELYGVLVEQAEE